MGHSIPSFAFRIDCERGRHFGPKGRRAREQSGAAVEKRSRSLDSVVEPTGSSLGAWPRNVQGQFAKNQQCLRPLHASSTTLNFAPQAKAAIARQEGLHGTENLPRSGKSR